VARIGIRTLRKRGVGRRLHWTVGRRPLSRPTTNGCVRERRYANVQPSSQRKAKAQSSNLGIAGFIACFITPGFFAFAETRIERLVMALIGLIFCGTLHVLATYKLNGLRE
jgi:hypothetical protein